MIQKKKEYQKPVSAVIKLRAKPCMHNGSDPAEEDGSHSRQTDFWDEE